eukprot:633757-Prymnesium_polylepis.1
MNKLENRFGKEQIRDQIREGTGFGIGMDKLHLQARANDLQGENHPRANDLQRIVVHLIGTVDNVTAACLRQSWGGEVEGAKMLEATVARLPDADGFLHHVRPDE